MTNRNTFSERLEAERISKRLEEIRASILAENVSYGELAELQGLAHRIDPSDTLLRQWAGVPEETETYQEEKDVWDSVGCVISGWYGQYATDMVIAMARGNGFWNEDLETVEASCERAMELHNASLWESIEYFWEAREDIGSRALDYLNEVCVVNGFYMDWEDGELYVFKTCDEDECNNDDEDECNNEECWNGRS